MFSATDDDESELDRRDCYAAPLGGCAGKISREHFLSQTLLAQLDSRTEITGFDPRDPERTELLPPATLTAKVLCRQHNSQLSEIDIDGTRAVTSCRDLDHALVPGGPPAQAAVRIVDGLALERWVAKVGLGLLHRGGSETRLTPDRQTALLDLVFNARPLPDPWGLYLEAAPGLVIFNEYDIAAEVRVHPQTHQAMAISVAVGSLRWMVALGRPDLQQTMYRPGEVVLAAADGRLRRLQVTWNAVPGLHQMVQLDRQN